MKFGNRGLQAYSMLIVAGDISGSTGTCAVFIKRGMHSLQNLRIPTHPQIIVGTPNRDPLILVAHMSAGKFLGQAIDVVEVAIGLVLVFLLKLGIVEFLIVKVGTVAVRGRV